MKLPWSGSPLEVNPVMGVTHVCNMQVLPPCPEKPPGAAVCLTSGTVWWFLLLAEDQVFLEHTAPS